MIDRWFHRSWIAIVGVVGAIVLAGGARVALAQGGHGWFVLDTPSTDSTKHAAIFHLPPPDRFSPRGTLRLVQGLTRAPERLGWSDGTLYVLMPSEPLGQSLNARSVYSISATAGPMGGWEYIPPDRPETLPTLAGKWGERDMRVVGFAAAPSTPAVLMERGKGTPEYFLLVLAGTDWIEGTLPWADDPAESPGKADTCRLITAGKSFGLLIERAGKATGSWQVASPEDLGALPQDVATDDAPAPTIAKLRWTSREVTVAPPGAPGPGATVEGRRDTVFCIENQLVRLTRSGKDVIISRLGAQEEVVSATLKGLGTDFRVAPVEGSPGFLAILSPSSKASGTTGDASQQGQISYHLLEIMPSGRILYDDEAKQGGLVSMHEVQLLSVLLVLVMAAVVVFVLRPDKSRAPAPITLPAGFAPADGGRRVMATVLDLGASWIVASLVARLDLADVARPDILLGTARGWQAVLTALALTIALGIVMEWQFGMTIGKMLLGCRVLGVHAAPSGQGGEAEAGRPPPIVASDGITFRAAAWRNLGKWTPWNLVEFMATGRQRPWSDRISGTIVVAMDRSDQEPEG